MKAQQERGAEIHREDSRFLVASLVHLYLTSSLVMVTSVFIVKVLLL